MVRRNVALEGLPENDAGTCLCMMGLRKPGGTPVVSPPRREGTAERLEQHMAHADFLLQAALWLGRPRRIWGR